MRNEFRYTWEQWFEEGDPFAYGNDGEVTGAVHLRRHGVDIGQAMKTGALWWRVDGNETDFENPWVSWHECLTFPAYLLIACLRVSCHTTTFFSWTRRCNQYRASTKLTR